jgi:hypothetical protein
MTLVSLSCPHWPALELELEAGLPGGREPRPPRSLRCSEGHQDKESSASAMSSVMAVVSRLRGQVCDARLVTLTSKLSTERSPARPLAQNLGNLLVVWA